jgi:bifunctional non-homologous end joining protein LigD
MMPYWFPCKPNRLSPTSELFKRLDNDRNWIAEVKKNGWRCLAYKEGGALTLWTRHHTTINAPLPDIRSLLVKILPDRCVIDGELIENRTKGIKGVYYVFDILALNGTFLNLPLRERRRLLEPILKVSEMGGPIELARQYQIGKVKLYHNSISGEENEGVVLKHVNSPYNASPARCLQNPYWLKVKRLEKHITGVNYGKSE